MPITESEVLRFNCCNFPFDLLLKESVKIASFYIKSGENPPSQPEAEFFVNSYFQPDNTDDIFIYKAEEQLLGLLYVSRFLNTTAQIQVFQNFLDSRIKLTECDVREITAFFSFKRGVGSTLMKSAISALDNPGAIYGETFSASTARVRRSLTEYTTYFGPSQITGREKGETHDHDALFRAYSEAKYLGVQDSGQYNNDWIGPVEKSGIPSSTIDLSGCPRIVCGVLDRINLASQAYQMIDPNLTAIAIIGSFRKDLLSTSSGEKD